MGSAAGTPAVLLRFLQLGVFLALGVAALGPAAQGSRKDAWLLLYFAWQIRKVNVTRLCRQRSILTVNGQFPGPTIRARRRDVVVVNVRNHGDKNITIHRHGVDQPRNPWSDGPEYVTQCPIQPGAAFAYRVILSQEEGTLWWHAHTGFDRATVHGAIVILPKHGTAFPFVQSAMEEMTPIILGEWWRNDDANQLLEDAVRTGRDVKPSDATTINGELGDLFPCSKPGTVRVRVERGKTYLLRAINAGLTNDMSSPTATGVVEYADAPPAARRGPPAFPATLPAVDDADAAEAYPARLRSLASEAHPVDVPARADERMLVTMAVNLIPCVGPNAACSGPRGDRLAASLNNVSFQNPAAVDILGAYYRGGSARGVYDADFPDVPPSLFNFTDSGIPVAGFVSPFTERGTRVKVLEHGAAVEDTAVLGTESHPMHLHGFSFYVVGRGLGNFDEGRDPAGYNLVDPPRQNTVAVHKGGWAAIRFRAKNPVRVWFMHCHFDRHVGWGMDTVFIVKDGKAPEAKMMRPPPDMPKC
ncbi:putative laccase-9 [Panicum miliaceum]|uniref:Laccase-9 n=1 Tax=Panicum miliaceum TaxID=4540 RepID=A0A3L6PE30_PANMI|nr:putative laccase-9 [Panicum miliaceum]